MKIQITKATHDDVLQIDQVIVSTWLHTYPDMLGVLHEDIRSFLGVKKKRIQGIESGLHNKNIIMLVARVGGDIAGVCFGYTKKDASVIKGLYILPKFQGHGIGSRLLKEFEQRTFVPIELHVLSRNTLAQKFYTAQGFSNTKKYTYFRIHNKRFRDNLYIKVQ